MITTDTLKPKLILPLALNLSLGIALLQLSNRDYSTQIDGSEAMRKVLEAEYPTVAQTARDVLAILATGVGVERSSMLAAIPAITITTGLMGRRLRWSCQANALNALESL
jgi:hypothetical protein